MEKKISRNVPDKTSVYLIFVLPVMIPFSLFFIIPFFTGAGYSLFQWNGVSSTMKFIGLSNYIELITNDSNYFVSLLFSLKFAILNVILTNLTALILALLLNMELRTKKVLRAAFFIPNLISAVVVGFIFVFVFSRITKNLFDLTGWQIFRFSWFGSPVSALFAMVLASVWQGAGYYMIIYLAALQTIDRSLIEAAEIDGAGSLMKFFNITLPLIMPALTVNLFLVTASSFRAFGLNLSLTGGGPGRTTTGLALDIYTDAFFNNRMGYGSAKAIVLFAIVMIFTIIQVKYTKSREVQL